MEPPFGGRGRGRATMRGSSALLPGRPTDSSSSSSSSSGPSLQPKEPGLPKGMARLSIAGSGGTPTSQGSGSTGTSSSGLGTSVQEAHRGRGVPRSTSPAGQRGTHRGFRHDGPKVTRREALATKQGKNGTAIRLKSNYFALEQAPSWNIHQYKVRIDPPTDSLRLRNGLIKRVFREIESPYIYVGGDLYSSTKIETKVHTLTDNKDPNNMFNITLEHAGEVESGDYTYIHVYNQLLRKFMFNMGLKEMGRCFYDTESPINIPEHKLTLFPGFVTSIRNHENQVLLCVETTNKVVRHDTVLDNINFEKGNNPGQMKKNLEDLIVGNVVLTPYNNQTYSIEAIAWDMTPASTFPYKGGSITFAEYFKLKYQLIVTDMSQPLLQAKLSKKDIHRNQRGKPTEEPPSSPLLVPEFSKMTGLSDQQRANFTLMKALAEHLHSSPQKRVEGLKKFMNKMLTNPEVEKELKAWTLGFEKELVQLPGRILPKQAIIFDKNQDPDPGSDKADWTMAFRSKRMATIGELKNWTVVVPQRDAGEVDNLVRTMDKVGRPLGLPIPRPTDIIKLPNASPGAYHKALEELRKKKNDLVFVVLANNKPELYGSIKRNLTGDQGTVSQCFLAKNLKSKGLMSIATKVVIQINAKLGGEPWTLKWPLKEMMVVGFDVYHGTKTTGGRNVAATVASISDTHARYYSTVSLYSTTDELANTVTADLMKCLDAYTQFNSTASLPTRILFFRDGVGDGQLQQLIDTELDQVKTALKTHYGEKGLDEPKLTYVVVNKKINTRLFTADPKEARNPPPGTVVDDVVTLPERYDFYLIPQAARQGAVSPSAYNVIWDTQNLDPDKIQLLTFKFCHMYYNWSGTVAVPAPCQYAHKLANLIGVAVGKEAHQKLNYNLHFL